MTYNQAFMTIKTKHLNTLKQYVPVVDRVHGKNHPEFHEVRAAYELLADKIKKAGAKRAGLHEEFHSLREITGGYTVPDDVCESYEAVYTMLRELDDAYHAE